MVNRYSPRPKGPLDHVPQQCETCWSNSVAPCGNPRRMLRMLAHVLIAGHRPVQWGHLSLPQSGEFGDLFCEAPNKTSPRERDIAEAQKRTVCDIAFKVDLSQRLTGHSKATRESPRRLWKRHGIVEMLNK